MSERSKNVSDRASGSTRSRSRNRRGSRDHGIYLPNSSHQTHRPHRPGKAMQKQKSKNKLKGRDLNRKGAEKEGTDMDAFVAVAAQPTKTEVETQPEEIIDALPIEISAKEKETTESKPDAEIEQVCQRPERKLANFETVTKNVTSIQNLPVVDVPVENHKETSKESTPTIEDSNKSVEITEKRANDVVDHANVKDVTDVEALVAQKNEENVKVSSQRASSEENSSGRVIDKQDENEPPNQIDSAPKFTMPKYTYNEYQWSPTNQTGKKTYDREFLMKVKEDPRSQVRPSGLPDLEVVFKSGGQPSRNVGESRVYKDIRGQHQFMPGFADKPSFQKPAIPGNKKSFQDNRKPKKPNVIHVTLSLREDVKLRESENAWKPGRVKSDNQADSDAKTHALYKKVRSVLNKLTPQKFDTLVNQVRTLDIDSQDKFEGVIDLVFQKAVDEPNFSVAYALMCKELAQMHVAGGAKKAAAETKQEKENKLDFRRLIVTRCQHEFENNAVDEVARSAKLKEIDECTDPEKKKELVLLLEDEDRRLRMKSVGNIRFIGELFKLGMIRSDIMHKCIKDLLRSPHEENLECLCKLLTTIGRTLESKGASNLSEYFNVMKDLSKNKTGSKKISSRVRFMLQDVIDLRARNWVPRRDEGNPKTMDQVVKDAESERLDIELMNSTPMNTPRKDDRNNDRRRNRAAGSEDGWSLPVGKTSRTQPYSVETSKLSAKVPSMDEIKLGGRSLFQWGGSNIGKSNPMTNKFAALENVPPTIDQDKRSSQIQLPGSRSTGATRDYRSDYKSSWENRGSRNGNHQLNSSSSSLSNRDSSREMPSMDSSRSQSMSMATPAMKLKPPSAPVSNKPAVTKDQLRQTIVSILDGINMMPTTEAFIDTALEHLSDKFDNSTYAFFVQESLNLILEKTSQARKRFSGLVAHMINTKLFPLSVFQAQCDQILKIAGDLVIDVPKLWEYIAEIISELVIRNAHPLSELKRTTSELRSEGLVGTLVGELLNIMAKDQGPKWVADKWTQSGLQWSDLVDTSLENPDEIVETSKLEFLTNGGDSSEISSTGSDLTLEQIHDQLFKLIRESSFDNITSWITASVGNRSKQPQFIRVLVTAILEVSIEQIKDSYKWNEDMFKSLQSLITRYVDTDPQLELQCLFAVQAYNHKLMHPQGILGHVIATLCENGIISDDAFLAWQKCTDPAEMPGHAVAVKALTSFFVNLQESLQESSEEA